MVKFLPSLSTFLQFLAAVLILGVVAVTYMPIAHPSISYVAAQAPYVVIGLFAAGLLSLILKQRQLMFVAFAGAACLSLILRNGTQTIEQVPATNTVFKTASSLKVAQFSTVNLSEFEDYGISTILDHRADLLCFQNLTPDWNEFLRDTLSEDYPFAYTFEGIGLQGVGIFSTTALGSVDSVVIAGITHVEACLSAEYADQDLRVIAVQTLPPVNRTAYQKLRAQLNIVAEIVDGYDDPTVVLGDFNSVPWSDALYDFARDANLVDSRRNVESVFVEGLPQLFEIPVEHIFYSPELFCAEYLTVRRGDRYLGNGATFHNYVKKKELASL